MNIPQALEIFILSCKADGLRSSTIKWYSSLLTAFAVWFSERSISEITTNNIRAYIVTLRQRDNRYVEARQKPQQDGGLAAASVAAHIRALHSFWNWTAREFAISNPMQNIKRPAKLQPMPRAIAAEDFIKLFESTGDDDAGKRDRAILAFLADTGCRVGGIAALTVDNLDLHQRHALVTEKAGRTRKIVFTKYTARITHQWLVARALLTNSEFLFVNLRTGSGLTATGIYQVLDRLKQRAGITGRVNPHAFRHNFARSYMMNGGDLATLTKLLGHSDISTTASYYAVFSSDELAEFHEKFSPIKDLR